MKEYTKKELVVLLGRYVREHGGITLEVAEKIIFDAKFPDALFPYALNWVKHYESLLSKQQELLKQMLELNPILDHFQAEIKAIDDDAINPELVHAHMDVIDQLLHVMSELNEIDLELKVMRGEEDNE